MIDHNRLGNGEETQQARRPFGVKRQLPYGEPSSPSSLSGLELVSQQVGQHPVVVVALGISIGCLLGWLAKRR